MKSKHDGESSPLMFEEANDQQNETTPEVELAKVVSRKGRTRKTSLVINDIVIVIVELFQILAVIQSMALKWTFPDTWIHATSFIFFVNFDFWEFMKIHSGVYKEIQSYDTPSQQMPFSYNFYLIFFAVLLIVITVVIMLVYVILRVRKRPYLFVHVARILRAATIMCQLLSIPVGVAVFRLFQCNSVGQVDVMNETQCFTAIHWAYIAPAIIILFVLFIVFPIWMVYRIRREVLSATTNQHESYLQLKEMEYMSGLDVIWVVKGFHLFSSFNLRAVWFRPIVQVFKLFVLIVYAAAFSNVFAQAVSTAILLFVFWLVILFLRPFRITSFNVLLVFGYLCLTGDAIFGACISASNPAIVASAWFVKPYAMWVLASINLLLLLACVIFVVHLTVYQFCCYQQFGKDPIWPSMVSRNNCQISKETKKYMYAVLKGRAILEKCRTMPGLFSPVNELSEQIQLINAYLREAEKLDDGLHDTLWDLLDEMIDTHEKIQPKSLFSDDVKDSIKYNAEEFLTYMPSFSRRLAQRDYDFILVSPLKKRLLLKMNILGMFLHGKKDRLEKQKITYDEINKIWPKPPMKKRDDLDGEYCDDLYPERLLGPDTEEMFQTSTLQLPLELVDIDEEDETESTSTLLKHNSISDFKSLSNSLVSIKSSGKTNPAFENEEYPDKSQKLILTGVEVGESSDTQDEINKQASQDEMNKQASQDQMNKQASDLISLIDGTADNKTNQPTVSIAGVEEGETNTDNIDDLQEEQKKTKVKKSKGGKGKKKK